MLKMVRFYYLLCLSLFHLSVLGLSGEESISLLSLHDSTQELSPPAATHLPIGVSVSGAELSAVSGSVLEAETWLRNHVLAHYPSTQISTIVVGHTLLCQDHNLGLVLPALRNVYHSLVRWGLQRDIKVSAAFSSSCFHPEDGFYRDDLAENIITPLLHFLQITNSTYSVNPPSKVSPLSDGFASLVSSHSESMKKLGFFKLVNNINVLVTNPKQTRPISRKLSSMDSKNPLPPTASPPPFSFPFAPEMAPADSPYAFDLPPCNVVDNPGPAPAPEVGVVQKLWCVAKPSVPPETLQEAVDYACGEGGADCEEIGPNGRCYNPDTVVAHASYAFNSYFQKNKRNGGTCNFGGTAMIINADPSYEDCRFVLS